MLRYDTQSVAVLLSKAIADYTRDNPPRCRPKGTKTECLVAVMPRVRQMQRDGYDRLEILEALKNDVFKIGPKLLTEAMKAAADGRSMRRIEDANAQRTGTELAVRAVGRGGARNGAERSVMMKADGQPSRSEDRVDPVNPTVGKPDPVAVVRSANDTRRAQAKPIAASTPPGTFQVKPDRPL